MIVDIQMYYNSVKLLHLHRTGRARPIGASRANATMQWIRTNGGKVIYIGLVPKNEVRL